jgi:hypothetical protein
MLQTVKSSFLILVIFSMFSAVYAADNNEGTKQPETIIHKAGIQVKSTRIYEGVPSQQEMDMQGKSIHEIKALNPPIITSTEENRGEPISNWSIEDYINVTPQKFHKGLRKEYISTKNKTYRPQITITPGDETNVEQRTAPISTWGAEDYLRVTPKEKHKAINGRQRAPIVTPGEPTDVMPRTRPISEFTKEDYLKIAPPSLHDAINIEGGTFTVGSSRSFEEITITISTDYYPSESSWNLYDSTAGAFYYETAQTFSASNEEQTVTLALAPGAYAVVAYDSYGDGGLSGTVTDENDVVIATIALTTGASGTYGFTVSAPTHDVTFSISIDIYASEGSWQVFTEEGTAVNTLQTFTTGSETQTVTLTLENGTYSLMLYDSYGDGWSSSGSVADANGNVLASYSSWYGSSLEVPFALGLYGVTVVVATDGYPGESSWNLWDATAESYYYTDENGDASNQTFTTAFEAQTVLFSLNAGTYSVDCYDSWGDGGMSGTVTAGAWTADTNLVQFSASGALYSAAFEITPPSGQLPDLFFSEYIEGSSNNKALEVYNPTEETLDLDDYLIYTNYNGNDFNGQYVFPEGTTLAPGDVFVVANSSAWDEVLRAADDSTSYSSSSAYVAHFNGDDVRALAKIKDADTTFIDVIGDYDFEADSSYDDPGSGFDVAGVNNATANHTLIRKPGVTMGNIDWTVSAGTDILDSEWLVYEQNYFFNIGGHPDDPCWGEELVFHGWDTYGDTWNGGNYLLTDSDGDTVLSGTGPAYEGYGNSVWHELENFCLEAGSYTFTFNTVSYGSEVQFYMTNAYNDTLLSCFSCMPNNSTTTYGLGVNAPAFTANSVNFDGIIVGENDTTNLVFSNSGFGTGSDMVVDSVSSSGASFTVSATGLPLTIESGENASIEVTYLPTTDTSHVGYAIFFHNGTTSPDSVMVSGYGVEGFFYEGFNPFTGSATVLPMSGWTILDNNEDADTIPEQWKTWYHDDAGTGATGNMVAYQGPTSNYDADEQLITPLIHTGDVAKLSFLTYDYDQYLGVGYSVDGTTFMDLADVYVNGYWQKHDINLPDVDSLWIEFTFDPDSGSTTSTTFLNLDEVKVTQIPNTYMDGWVENQDTDLGLGGVSVKLNGSEVTKTGENELYLDPGFEDSSFVGTYLSAPEGGWWVYPTTLTNFAHMTDGDLVYVDTSAALGTNELSVREGDKALKMWGQFTGAENYTSIYQQIGAVEEGQEMYVGAWAMSHSDGPLTGGTAFFVAINWLASDFSFIGQDQSVWLDSTYINENDLDWNEWHYMDVHGVAPAGVAHVQLQLTFYQPAGYATGSVYVDAAQATMHPGHYKYRGMDEGTYSVDFSLEDYNPAVFTNVEITDDVADTTRLDVGLAPHNLTDFEAGFEADQDSGSTDITSGSASFMVMDSLRLTIIDTTVFTDTTTTGLDTTWTVYDTTEYNVDPYAGDGMLVYGPTRSQGSVYEDSAYAMWVSGESFDITDYMGEGGNLSMYYRRNMNVATGDYFYVGVMLDDSTVWWGDYDDHTGSTFGSWSYSSTDLTWLRELTEDSSTTATPVIIFDSNDSLVTGWGGAFDDFHVNGNPWFMMKPGNLRAESFNSYVPLEWDEPMSSGRVTYEVHGFHMSELGGSQPPTIQTRTVTSEFDNSAISRDVMEYTVHRQLWDATTMQIGDMEPLAVTSGTSWHDFDMSDGDRADYHVTVRYEDGDMPTPSKSAHARVGVPYVMLVDSFATTTTFDSTFGEHWEIWSGSETATWVIGDSTAAHGASGYTGTTASYHIPEHVDTVYTDTTATGADTTWTTGGFAYISNGRSQGKTVLLTPFLDFRGHASALLEFDAFAMTSGQFRDPVAYPNNDHAAVYVRSQSEPWHLAVNVSYNHSTDNNGDGEPDGWVQERADLGMLVGNKDRVQFGIVWRAGSYTNFAGDILAIDDFTVKTLDGPTNLTATATTESVTLNWEGLDGRRGNEYPELLSAEEKARAVQLSNTAIGKTFSQTGSMNKSLVNTNTDDDVVVTNNNSRDTGDDLSDPFILTIPDDGDTIVTGTTVGFANDYDAVCPYSGSTSPDVVYKLVLADSVNGLIIDLCESYYDSKVYLYLEDSLATGDTTNVACNDDFCSASHGQSFTSYIELGHQLFGGVSAGTYYIVLDGYGGASGEYVMDIKIMSPPPDMTYNVFKDDWMVAPELPDTILTYVDNNISLMESEYWVNASRIMEVSSERPFYGPPNYNTPAADFDVRYVGTDHSNHVHAAMVNTPPGAFALVTPPNGQELVITHDNIGGGQIFGWSSSVDPNGSTVTYHATLQVSTGTDTLEISTDTTGTAIFVPHASIAEVMTAYATATGNYTADVSWTVYANDGWDELEASNGPRSVSVDIGWYLGMNDEALIPDVFALHQNYPNPFNPVTTIRYDIPEQAFVRIDIYNILGQKVAVLAEGLHEPGFHAVRWNGTNMYGNALSSGMYFYHIKAGDFRNVKKLLLVK